MSEFVTGTNFGSLVTLINIFGIPFLPQLLIRGYIIHHLVVHRAGKAGEHGEEYETVHDDNTIEDMNKSLETSDLFNFLLDDNTIDDFFLLVITPQHLIKDRIGDVEEEEDADNERN